MHRLLFAAFLCLAALAAQAQTTETATFDLRIASLRAGVFSLSSVEDGRQYSLAARATSAGLASILSEVSFEGRATGRLTAQGFVPTRYQEAANTGERVSRAVMEYRRGVPQVQAYDPPQAPRPTDIDPATQGGTVDPLTALHAVLREVPHDAVCRVDLAVFDGRRASRVTLSAAQAQGDRILCPGEYRRVAGFSEGQMQRRTRFPFTITYAPVGEGRYRVERIVIETLYGRATLDRR
jgi:hypothetical protein